MPYRVTHAIIAVALLYAMMFMVGFARTIPRWLYPPCHVSFHFICNRPLEEP